MTAEHKRWYDFEPTVSLAVSLLRNAQTNTRTECADFIIDYAKSFGVQLPNDIFSKFDYVLKRWYDEDKQLSEAFMSNLKPEFETDNFGNIKGICFRMDY